MINRKSKKERVNKRHFRIRKKISGTKELPRLTFQKSNKHIYAQLVDDLKAHTISFCSTVQTAIRKELKSTWSCDAAKLVGESIAKDALLKGVKEVVFDRGGNRYHGKVIAFAEGARAQGLKF